MREETKARLRRLREALLDGWVREIRHPDRLSGNSALIDDPNHPIR